MIISRLVVLRNQGRNEIPTLIFLFLKSAGPNTPNKNQNTPKEIFVTPRVFGNNFIMLASYESIVVLRYSKT